MQSQIDPKMEFILTQEGSPLKLNYLVAVLLTVFVFLYATTRRFNKKKASSKRLEGTVFGLEKISGPRPVLGLKLIGNLPQLLPFSNILPKFVEWSRTYPNILRASALNMSFVGLISPNTIHQLLKSSEFGHGVKSPLVYGKMKPFLTNSLGVSKNKFWQKQRKIMMKTQSFQNLKAYVEMLNRHSERFVKILDKVFEDQKFHQINDRINVLFLDVICEMITGNNAIPSAETHRYHHNFQIWKESFLTRVLYPWLWIDVLWNLLPMSKPQKNAIKEMFDFAKRRIKEHRGTLAKASKDGAIRTERKTHVTTSAFRSMLDELVDAGVDEDQILDEVNVVIFGGHETGATVIHFFLLMMALNPEVQKLCQEEIDQLYRDIDADNSKEISFEEATSGLKYLERCIQETMRLYPPAFVIFRQLETSLTIESDGNKYELPVGTNVGVCPYATHRNVQDYPEPEKFDPDRFLPENVAQRHSCSFIPFSGRSRSCLASKFAMIEMKVVAAYIVRNFEIRTTTCIEDVKLLPFITLTPDKDFDFQFIKRAI